MLLLTAEEFAVVNGLKKIPDYFIGAPFMTALH